MTPQKMETAATTPREGKLEVSGLETSTSHGNVFEESLESDECLVHLMRNLEQRGEENNPIKGEKELTDIGKAKKFVSKKIDESKKDILEKEKLINDLKSKVSSLSGRIGI